METIKNNFRKFGENFSMIGENEKGFIFERTDGKVTYYEVFKKVRNEKSPFADELKTKFRYPGNEDFGAWAWCCVSKDKAMTKFINF